MSARGRTSRPNADGDAWTDRLELKRRFRVVNGPGPSMAFGFVCGSTRGLLRTAKDRNPRWRFLMLRIWSDCPGIDIGKNGETTHNGRIIEISPAEEGVSP